MSKLSPVVGFFVCITLLPLLLFACSINPPNPQSITPVTNEPFNSQMTALALLPTPTTATRAIVLFPLLPLASTNDWEFGWLKGIPCYLPCWQNIKVGDKSLDSLNQIKMNDHMTNIKNKNDNDTTRVTWNWQNASSGGGAISYSSQSSLSIINTINVSFDKTFELKDVIQVYGYPSHVAAMEHINIDKSKDFVTIQASRSGKGG